MILKKQYIYQIVYMYGNLEFKLKFLEFKLRYRI